MYEEMTLTEYRDQVLAEFETIGVTAYCWYDEKKESPCVVLFNDNPMIEKPDTETMESNVWKVNMYLVLIAEMRDGDLSASQLDNLISTTLEIVGDLDDVVVGNVGTVEDRDAFASTVSFSKTFKLRKEDIK